MTFDDLAQQIEETGRLIVVYRHAPMKSSSVLKIKSIAGAGLSTELSSLRPRSAIRSSIYLRDGLRRCGQSSKNSTPKIDNPLCRPDAAATKIRSAPFQNPTFRIYGGGEMATERAEKSVVENDLVDDQDRVVRVEVGPEKAAGARSMPGR